MYRYSSRVKKVNKWYILLVLVVVLAVGGYFGFKVLNKPSPIPAQNTKGISFKLYYPKVLPQGYSVDQSSYNNPERTILTFNIKQPKGPAIGVAEQGVPPDLNLNQQTNAPAGVRLPTTHFSTSIGQATIDQWGPKKVCYIVAGQTWIILNVTDIKDEQIRSLARSFGPVN